MILDNAALLKIITERPSKKWLTAIQIYTKKLMMHIEGLGMDEYIERIMEFEKPDLIAIRKKYAVSNKALFARINRPTDKIFSAKGGSIYYNLSEEQTATMRDYVNNVVDGLTLKQWLRRFWMPAMGYDPMGVILMEIDANGNPYPSYKSVLDIYEYKLKGCSRNLEYIIFKLPQQQMSLTTNQMNGEPNSNNKGDQRLLDAVANGAGAPSELYRVIDDAFDRIVKVTSTGIVEVPNETYLNPWMTVPASIISDIYKPVLGQYISTEDAIIDLADQFLREGSVKNIIMNYHGFPRAWEYQSACPDCKGTGVLHGEKCEYCKGSKIKTRSFPEETIRIPTPQTTEQPKIAPDVAGYITPPVEGIKLFVEQLESLEDLMYETKWGTHMADDTKKGGSETATGKFIDVQPIYDKLNELADAGESIEKFITNKIGQILFGQSYKGASIGYGRRFLMETPDALWNKLRDSTPFSVPEPALDKIYDNYLQVELQSNPTELIYMQKLALIEPMQWIKAADVARMTTFPDLFVRDKVWFGKWKKRISKAEIMVKTVLELQNEFDAFCLLEDTKANARILQNPALNEQATPPEPPVEGAPLPGNKPQPGKQKIPI